MASRRKPLDVACRNVRARLNEISEQKDYIQNFAEQLDNGVKLAANSLLLLAEKNKTKFFQKYRAVSQQLEKCLDDMLLVSATISSLEDGEGEEEGEDEDGEDGEDEESPSAEDEHKPADVGDDLSPTASHEVQNDLKNEDLSESSIKCSQAEEKQSLLCSPNDDTTSAKDLIDFETQSSCSSYEKEKKSNSSYSLNDPQNERKDKSNRSLTSNAKRGDFVAAIDSQKPRPSLVFESNQSDSLATGGAANEQASLCFNLIDIGDPEPTSLQLSNICKKEEINDECSSPNEEATKDIKQESRPDSTSYINDLFMSNPPLDLTEEAKAANSDSRRGSFGEEIVSPESRKLEFQIPAFEIPDDNCIKVVVKEIVSPKDFWIQKANDDVDLLMEEMCYYFSKRAKSGDKGGLQDLPDVGHVCCGKYTFDQVWYRALVTAVSFENNQVAVLYVDEGISETLPLSGLRELDEKFMSLPRQALRVQLRDLELSNDISPDEVNDWFKRRVTGETLEAVIDGNDFHLNPVPLDLYIRPHARSASDVDCKKLEYSIHEMLIREGFAIRAASPRRSGTSDDVSPLSSPGDQAVKSESIVSSLVTSGFHDAPSPTPDVLSSQDNPGCQGNSVTSSCRVPPPHIPVDSDGSVYMLVSHVVSPAEFYVHLISSEAGMLDNLMTEMNLAYKDLDSRNCDNFSPRVGGFCCAKFSVDGNWYRGLVLQVRCSGGDSDEKGATVEVFYIDFGNIEQVDVEDVRELLPQYMTLPAQVVRCLLADVNPSIREECDGDVFDSDTATEQDDASKRRSSRQRSRGHKATPRAKGLVIAAGDEDSEEDEDMDLLGLIPDIEKHEHRDRTRSSISDDIARSYREPSLFSNTAVELFEKIWMGVEEISLKPNWSENATEYFKTLTLDARKLIGYIVPWDSTMMNNVLNYSQSAESSLPNLGPVLRLNLYDVSGYGDVFINAAMVRAKYASSNSIKDDTAAPYYDMILSLTENTNADVETSLEHIPVVRVSLSELSDIAASQRETDPTSTSPPRSTTPTSGMDPSSPSTPMSPTTQELDAWNPMSSDFQSYRNVYNVETDNVNVAITGYEEDTNKICRFYRTKYGCFRGSRCRDQHVEQDYSENVFVNSPCDDLKMFPVIGTCVLVKVTTVYNPSRFSVHLPAGVEDLATQMIQSRSGREASGQKILKDFNNMMTEMSELYSRMSRRERSLIPPTVGELVVVRSERDKRWYRGTVCEERENKYKVSLVDYGILEWAVRANIYPIIPQFLHLPFHSLDCFMFSIAPTAERWTEDARQHFGSLVEGKILVCEIVNVDQEERMFVNLFESDKGESRSIGEQMINSGHAITSTDIALFGQ